MNTQAPDYETEMSNNIQKHLLKPQLSHLSIFSLMKFVTITQSCETNAVGPKFTGNEKEISDIEKGKIASHIAFGGI